MTEAQLRAQMRAYWLRKYSREQIRELFGPAFGEDGDRVPLINDQCEFCGQPFVRKAISPRQRFCSDRHRKLSYQGRAAA